MPEQDKSYPVTFVTKQDLSELAPEFSHCIEALSDEDMTAFASEIGKAMQIAFRSTLYGLLYDYFHDERGCIGTDELEELENDRIDNYL